MIESTEFVGFVDDLTSLNNTSCYSILCSEFQNFKVLVYTMLKKTLLGVCCIQLVYENLAKHEEMTPIFIYSNISLRDAPLNMKGWSLEFGLW